jgi:hypothetical protein
MTNPLYSCMAKASSAVGDQLKYGPNWMLARRARLLVFNDRLECGDWRIENTEIKNAVLYSVRQSFVIPGYILKVETENKTYHFGLNYGSFWKGDLPFSVQRENGRLAYSPFSIVLRIAALAYLGYLLWQYLQK